MKLSPRAASLYDKYDKTWFANEVARLEGEIADWEASFELYYTASMRGIKMWQEATGKDMVWPDQGELTAWLIEKIDKTKAAIKAAQRYIYWMDKRGGKWFTSAPTEYQEKAEIKRAFLEAFEDLNEDN
jgi:hypothetical protein